MEDPLMAIDPARVKFLFQAAIERTDPGDRTAFLDRETGGDVELRGRLDALLAVAMAARTGLEPTTKPTGARPWASATSAAKPSPPRDPPG